MKTRIRVARRAGSFTALLLAVSSILAASDRHLWAANSDLRLVDAVKHQNTDEIRALLTQQLDVNATEGDGSTALHWAAYRDDLQTVALLIQAGANPNPANEHGVTPLSLACTNGNAAMVETLLAAGADANAALKTGETVLMTCARAGSAEAVTAILTRGADVNAKEGSEHQTALMWATAQRHPAVVRVLIEHGADIHAQSRVSRQVITRDGRKAEEADVGGFTALLFAARQGDVDSARLLLAGGADRNDASPDGTSALVVATRSGQRAFAQFLLDQGASPDAAGAGYTALHAAVLSGDRDLVRSLLAHGANVNARITQGTRVTRFGQVAELSNVLSGATPFALAAKFIELDIMRLLVNSGADPAIPLKNGWTPLMLAAGAGWSRAPDTDRRNRLLNNDLATQAEISNERGTLEVVKMLVELKADVNAADDRGDTALHHLVETGFNGVVEFLAMSGANVNAKNKLGQTPLAALRASRTLGGNAAGGGNLEGYEALVQATNDLLLKFGADDPGTPLARKVGDPAR